LRLCALEGACTVTARAVFAQLSITAPAQVSEVGGVTVAASPFLQLLGGATAEQVEIQADANRVEARLGAGQFQLPAARVATELMHIAGPARRVHLADPRRHFGPLLTGNVKSSIAGGGILLQVDEQAITTAATDGTVLAAVTSERPAGDSAEAIVPATAAAEISALVKSGPVGLTIEDHLIQAKGDGWTFVSPLCAGPYPQWRRIVPPPSEHRCELARVELLGALERFEAVASPKLPHGLAVIGRGGGTQLELRLDDEIQTAHDHIGGAGTDCIVLPMERATALFEALKVERIVLDQADPRSPIRFTSPDDPGLVVILAAIEQPPELINYLDRERAAALT
jgi:DNA polymerase III sliding clamp (beta) subunit (PCNA family)